MPEFQPVSSASIAAIERPSCPKCKQSRMLLSRLEPGSPGVGYRTFECQSCGCVRTMVISSDPMNSRTQGWFGGELRRPT
jgi:hypothetical protein